MTLGRTVQSAGTWSMNESWLGVVGNQKTLCTCLLWQRIRSKFSPCRKLGGKQGAFRPGFGNLFKTPNVWSQPDHVESGFLVLQTLTPQEPLLAMPRKHLKFRGWVGLWGDHLRDIGAFSFNLGFTTSFLCMFSDLLSLGDRPTRS